ncbi:MAG TPA: NarK/NasA family nitrate transporter [Alphaproteobacteria bacterium]|nr:NarK/NasA family nitrate transporter [Alphaproteobacteria bacterium]
MSFSRFLKTGHIGTLISSFIYSDMSFMVWIMLGPLAVYISLDLELTEAQQYTMVTLPLLAGVLFRIPMGILVDRFAPKQTGMIAQAIVIVVLFFAYISNVDSIAGIYVVGLALGLAGTSMAVALPLSSRWYPDEYQGVVLGIAGAASSGTVFAAAFAPMLAEAYGWRSVFGFAIIPLLVTLVLFYYLARDSHDRPQPQKIGHYWHVLGDVDSWWFMLFYGLTFGGVIALSSVMVLYFHLQYGLEPVTAGYYTAACILAGTALRPVGGWMADRYGGIRSMQHLFAVTAVCMFVVSFSIPYTWLVVILLIVGTASLGMGSGAVFQLVPLRFRKEVGAVTGMVGAAGGLGGFFLAWFMFQSKQLTNDFSLGFFMFSILSVLSLYGIHRVKSRWRTTWGSGALTSARV